MTKQSKSYFVEVLARCNVGTRLKTKAVCFWRYVEVFLPNRSSLNGSGDRKKFKWFDFPHFQTLELDIPWSAPLQTSHRGECHLNRDASREKRSCPFQRCPCLHIQSFQTCCVFFSSHARLVSASGRTSPGDPAQTPGSRTKWAAAVHPFWERENAGADRRVGLALWAGPWTNPGSGSCGPAWRGSGGEGERLDQAEVGGFGGGVTGCASCWCSRSLGLGWERRGGAGLRWVGPEGGALAGGLLSAGAEPCQD